MTTLIFLSQLVIVAIIGKMVHFLFKLKKGIFMNQQELAQALSDLSDKFQKGIDEVKAAVANSGNTSPEVDAALAKLQGFGEELDELNPDTTT